VNDPERDLLLGVLTQAVLDLPGDGVAGFDWLLGPIAGAYMTLLGLSEEMQFALRLRALLGLIDRGKFDARPLHAQRFGDSRKSARHAAEAASWQTW
jgi:hypothetical protein